MSITFFVPGQPQGKGRAKAGRGAGGHVRMYTPGKTVAYEGLVALAASQAMSRKSLDAFLGPVFLCMDIGLKVPASWSKVKREIALAGGLLPTTKPDIDNTEKIVADALNGVVWGDDTQVVLVAKRKRYAATPGVRVWVVPLDAKAHGLDCLQLQVAWDDTDYWHEPCAATETTTA